MATANYTSFMDAALALAETALTVGEIPVGAVVVQSGKIVGRGHNRTRIDQDPTAHAEIVAIREATRFLGNDRLEDCDLWVTLEPCTMCAGAIAHARVGRLYYGASDAKGGAVVGLEWEKRVTGDMTRDGVGKHAHVTLSGNRVR